MTYYISLDTDLDKGIGAGRPLDETDFANGDKVDMNAQNGDPLQDLMETSGLFEGDIILSDEEIAEMSNNTEEALNGYRSATTRRDRKWKKRGSTVQVPYVLSSSYDEKERAYISRAIKEYQSKTCIR